MTRFRNPPTPGMLDWLLNASTGTSSLTMLGCHLGIPRNFWGIPLNEHDLERCKDLVNRCPEIRESFDDLAALHQAWAIVTANWDALNDTYVNSGKRAMGDHLRRLYGI